MDPLSDLIDLLGVFDEEDVEYLLVGGQAVALHGAPRFTKDADIWIRETPENCARGARALGKFGAPRSVVAAFLGASGLDVVWMGQPPARIDLMKNVPGGDFEKAWGSRCAFDLGGQRVWCVSRDELMAQKLSSGRPQDLLDVEKLRAADRRSTPPED